MKKTIAPAVALALGLSSFAAFADPISHSLTINATVQAGCTASGPTGSTGFTISGTSSTFATAVTGTTQAPNAGTLTFGTLVCTTTGVKVTLISARMGLFKDGNLGSLDKYMTYVATPKLNNTVIPNATLTAKLGNPNNRTGQISLPSGSNEIRVSITFPGTESELIPNGALTAGTYTDTLTIGIDGVAI